MTKTGTVEFAIAATPESMCFSPQAMSVKGSAPLMIPRTSPSRDAARTWETAVRKPMLTHSSPKRGTAAISMRSAISVVGAKSRTPTLMNR